MTETAPPTQSLTILQTCLPDYRLPFFERLMITRPEARLLCGREYFTKSLALCREPARWRSIVENHFLFRRGILWQSEVMRPAMKADVLIAEFNPRVLSTWWILIYRWLAGKPTLLWGHLWGQHGPQWLARHVRLLMLRLADGMICYTRSQRDELKRILPEQPAWAASNSCVTRAQCMATEAPTSAGCVTYVGRLIGDKKPALLLEAFARALDRLPSDARLLLIGDGGERAALKARVVELGLTGRVEMPGHVGSEAELKKIYARSAVAVSPGYVGLSAIQAMAFGVPMLISRDEPHSPEIEACVEGKTAAFFGTDDADALADKLVEFYTPRSPWRTRREVISRFVAENYTFDGMVETFVEAIEAVTDAPKNKPGPILPGKDGEVPVAIAWAQFGPYHLARLRALHRVLGEARVIGVEIGSRTSTYAWRREVAQADRLVTLLPGQTAESASASAIYRRALQLFRQHKVEAVFVPSYWPASSLAVMLAARSAGARIIMMNDTHAHTAKARGIWAELKRRLVLQFDAALVAGEPQKEYFVGMGLAAEKIVTGYDAVDNEFFEHAALSARSQAAETRVKHGLPARYFLNVGRMVWKKNLEALIDAYRLAKNRLGADCPALVLVGGGKQERMLRERCLTHGLSVHQTPVGAGEGKPGVADVYFMGFRQVDELPDFYALAECFVLASREEEWGLVVNEAMACGLPVLVSSVAGCARDLVRHGENGFLFDPFNAKELAGCLETIGREPVRARKMGEASQRMIAHWGCERFAVAAHRAVEIALHGEAGDLNLKPVCKYP